MRKYITERIIGLYQELEVFEKTLQRLEASLGYKYSPDQPRDDHGRWTSEGGTANNPTYQGEPDLPLEPVYPLETVIGLLAGSQLFAAWRGLAAVVTAEAEGATASTEWTLGAFKSPQRWANQIEKRGWTPDDITNTIANGDAFEAPNY